MILTTPKGIAVYPKLTAPDTKFKKLGEYSIKLRVDPKLAAPLVEMIDAKRDEYIAALKEKGEKKVSKKADQPYAVDEETGDVVFSFKKAAAYEEKDGTIKKQSPPRVVDSKSNPVTEQVWSGSECKVAFSITGWFFQGKAGVRLPFVAVQVLKLVTGETFGGFEDEEGFESTPPEEEGIRGSGASTDF